LRRRCSVFQLDIFIHDRLPATVTVLARVTVALLCLPGAWLSAQENASAGGPPRRQVDTVLAHADRLVAPLIEGRVSVGVAVGVLYGGKTGARGYGLMKKGGSKKPDASTIYEIGSITKVFTGVLLADAVQRKLVKLSDPIQKFVPKDTTVPRFKGQEILFAHLTSHTSALPRMPVNWDGADPKDPFAHYDEDLLYAGLGETTLPRLPGKTYAYSNLAAGLLGHLLVRMQGSDRYQSLLDARICTPLGLKDTVTRVSKAQAKRLAPPYTATGDERQNWTFYALVGAGGLRSTVTDMLNFSAAVLGLKGLEGDAGHLQDAFRLTQQPLYVPGFPQRWTKPSVGCGWHLGPGKNLVWHNGATAGYRSMLLLDTKEKSAVVVLSNTTSKLVDKVARQIYDAAAGKKVTPVAVRKPVTVPVSRLQRYVGRYKLSPTLIFDITVKGEILQAQLTGQPAFTVLPASKRRFFYRAVKAEIEFHVGKDGKAEKLVLFQNGRALPAIRIR
jgi:D-alanyl-D-alanine-carboxypeptidase/D-alanyl-D-alanine-endopeptidase